MSKNRDNVKKFRIFYFTGDYFSYEGEKQHSTVIRAETESEAIRTFKKMYPSYSFGWAEQI